MNIGLDFMRLGEEREFEDFKGKMVLNKIFQRVWRCGQMVIFY